MPRRWPLPSARWLALAGAAAAVLAIDATAGLVCDAALVALLIVDAVRGARADDVDVALALPARLAQGQTHEATLMLRGRLRDVRVAVDVPDALDAHDAGAPRAVRVPATLPVTLAAHGRGRHVVGPVHLRVASPLGLAWLQRVVPLAHAVEVVPGLQEIRSWRLLAARHQLSRAGLRPVRGRGEGTAFESLREYVRGDNPRHLDWKASARHRKPIVRQYEAERSQAIMLCIDTGRLMSEQVGTGDRLDRALAAAVVLADVARAWDDHVGVLAFSDRVEAFLPPARWAPSALPGLFAGLAARPVEPDYPRALTQLARTLRRRALVVVLGDAVDPEVSAPLAAHLGRLAARHLPLFVALRNPLLFAAAHAPADDRAAAFARAAAAELVLARQRALAALRQRGVLVADVAPEGAVAAAVNRYLAIKRRGAL